MGLPTSASCPTGSSHHFVDGKPNNKRTYNDNNDNSMRDSGGDICSSSQFGSSSSSSVIKLLVKQKKNQQQLDCQSQPQLAQQCIAVNANTNTNHHQHNHHNHYHNNNHYQYNKIIPLSTTAAPPLHLSKAKCQSLLSTSATTTNYYHNHPVKPFSASSCPNRPPPPPQQSNHYFYYLFFFYLFICLSYTFSSVLIVNAQRQNLPDLSDTQNKPIRVLVGDDINIDCVIKNRNNLTIFWKYVNGSDESLLAVNEAIVSNDRRLSVVHENAQERWILQIRYARVQDTGIYKCEVNSIPKVYETRMVMVNVRKTFADVLKGNVASVPLKTDVIGNDPMLTNNNNRGSYMPDYTRHSPNRTTFVDRSFYECCQMEGVPISCRFMCNLNTMLNGQSMHTTMCFNHMPQIYRCIADGRNHLPCCQRQNVPKLCQPACTGRYTLYKALDHAICQEHSKTILYCIADGIQVLPEQPQDLSAETVNSTYILVKWTNKESKQKLHYKIMHRELTTFDNNWQKANESMEQIRPETMIIGSNQTEILLGPLKKSTMYEIKMISFNKFGESLPTNDLRVVTHRPPEELTTITTDTSTTDDKPGDETGSNSRKKVIDSTEMEGETKDVAPNLRGCCSNKGVKNEACLKQLCEPFIIEPVEVEESIMCMKYMNTSYKCIEEIRENVDYEKCCEEEGVSAFCKHFCSGKTSLLYDFQSQFQCLPYMSSLISCVLEQKGFVTTEPKLVSVSSVNTDWALVQWLPPKKKSETVLKYQVHYREISEDADDFYFVEIAIKSPFLIDKLRPETRYEVFVTSVNKHGVSRGSGRVLFNTTSPEVDPNLDQTDDTINNLGYNETLCCEKANVKNVCLPLCNYHLKMADLLKLSLFCAEPRTARSILRCLAGGRDHRPCCARRGIDKDCFDLCNGMITFTSRDVASKCSQYDGKIFQCMAEGANTIPGMPVHLHAANITFSSIGISWNKSLDELPLSDPITYQILYVPVPANQTIPPHPFDDKYSTKLNVSNTRFTLTNLKANTSYSIYVVASNQYGSSAPSQVLIVSTNGADSSDINTNVTHATIGAPHSLELLRKSITALIFRWSEPHYSSPDVTFSYEVLFQKVNAKNPANNSKVILHTSSNLIAIQNLTRNTQYAIAVRARTSTGLVSPLSETILAWTDPSLPLEISQPFIHPFPVIEGSMVTVRCESIGYPVPNMTIFVNGVKVKTDLTRVIHYSVDYVERNLSAIACQAVNEESRHPVQSFREVNVHFAPTITLYKETKVAQKFSIVMLECEFAGFPKPKIRFLKGSMLISRFNNSRVFPHLKKPKTWVATLVLANVDQSYVGNYDCIARNDYGEEKKTLKLLIEDEELVPKNHTQCCQDKSIPSECMYVCNKKEINLFDVYKNQKCLEHLNKYIACAADGSDHRRCCMFREVAPDCLHWCAGYKLQKMDYCLVSSARDIMSCFREGNKFLPSPPVNVHVKTIYSDRHISIVWEDSDKNQDATHWYWVYWKKVGTNEMDRERVEDNEFELTALEPDSTYEFVVKTSNYHGTSVLSDPLVINLSNLKTEYLTSQNQVFTNVFLTLFFLMLIFASVGFVAYITYKNNFLVKFRRSPSCNSNIGVSFENHAYNLDDTIPMQESSPNGNGTNSGGNGTIIPNGASSNNSNGFNGANRNGPIAGSDSPPQLVIGEANLFTADQNNNPNGQNGQPRVQIRLN